MEVKIDVEQEKWAEWTENVVADGLARHKNPKKFLRGKNKKNRKIGSLNVC